MMRANGYILVETIVAMSVLSVSMIAIHQGVKNAALVRAQADDVTVAHFLLQQVVSERDMQPQLAVSKGEGQFEAPFERFSYAWEVTKVDVPTPQIPADLNLDEEQQAYFQQMFKKYMGRLRVTIRWTRLGQEREVTGEPLLGRYKLWLPANER